MRGVCPICLLFFEGLHEHHCIPREYTLNGIKGVDGPLVNICSSCHDLLHRTAAAIVAGKPRQYFTNAQLPRATNLIKLLVQSTLVNRDVQASGQERKVVLRFNQLEMERLHAAKKDHGYTNLAVFLQDTIRNKIGYR